MDKEGKSFTGEQGDFFHRLENMEPEYLAANAPDLDIEEMLRLFLKESLKQAIKRGLSRERVLERINNCLRERRRKITMRQLNGWLAASAEERPFPAWVLPAFIWATRGNLGPLEVITKPLGLHVIDDQEMAAVELGEAVLQKTRIAKRERAIRSKLGG